MVMLKVIEEERGGDTSCHIHEVLAMALEGSVYLLIECGC